MAYRSFSLSGFEARGVRKVTTTLCDFKRGSEKLPTPSPATRWATPSNCSDILLRHWYRLSVETLARHPRETWGHGDNPVNRDNEQPSPKDSTESMDAVHRLNVGGWAPVEQLGIACLRYSRSAP